MPCKNSTHDITSSIIIEDILTAFFFFLIIISFSYLFKRKDMGIKAGQHGRNQTPKFFRIDL